MSEAANTKLTISPKEKEVLAHIAMGKTQAEIAHKLGRSVKTIEKHVQKIHDKLGLHRIALLTHYAIATGIVPLTTNHNTPIPPRCSGARAH